jgi:hypothetical protein
MNPSLRRGIGLACAVFLAALAQSVYADALQIRGARPDFLVTVALLGALFCDTNGGAALGFFAGLLHASLASPPAGGFGALILSRTVVAGMVGWLDERLFRDHPLIVLLIVPAGTALADALFFLVAPQPNTFLWLRALGLTLLYNTVLTLPIYFVLTRLTGEYRKRQAF